MKGFILGLIAGVGLAVGGYKPYQIEMEYRHNVATGLTELPPITRCYSTGGIFPSEQL